MIKMIIMEVKSDRHTSSMSRNQQQQYFLKQNHKICTKKEITLQNKKRKTHQHWQLSALNWQLTITTAAATIRKTNTKWKIKQRNDISDFQTYTISVVNISTYASITIHRHANHIFIVFVVRVFCLFVCLYMRFDVAFMVFGA